MKESTKDLIFISVVGGCLGLCEKSITNWEFWVSIITIDLVYFKLIRNTNNTCETQK